MTKVTIEGTFNTSMGLILQVKNDRVFKVGDVVNAEDGRYIIDRLTYSTNPDYDGYVGLVVSKTDK